MWRVQSVWRVPGKSSRWDFQGPNLHHAPVTDQEDPGKVVPLQLQCGEAYVIGFRGRDWCSFGGPDSLRGAREQPWAVTSAGRFRAMQLLAIV